MNTLKNDSEPTEDESAGIAWWNSATEEDRRFWMHRAGDTGRAVDAWNAYKQATQSATRKE